MTLARERPELPAEGREAAVLEWLAEEDVDVDGRGEEEPPDGWPPEVTGLAPVLEGEELRGADEDGEEEEGDGLAAGGADGADDGRLAGGVFACATGALPPL